MTAAPDLPAPGFQSAEDRLQISRRFLIHAREELGKGRRLQAGNKAYGAVVQPLKVIAEQRGWKHHSNNNIRDIGSMVAWEYQNHDLSELFGEVYHVGHENYYENQHEPGRTGKPAGRPGRVASHVDCPHCGATPSGYYRQQQQSKDGCKG